uniref:Uncharacterized protein n=1 Tax=Chenopodium quinoa TaxID=63459 RepID=A0A803KM97_CHEQI
MESYEATRAVFSMVQSIDPENASKIMGYILIHHTEKDMIRFAHGSESLIFSILNRAKNDLGLLSNTSSASPSMANSSHASHPITISRPNPLSLSLPSPRLPNNGFNPSSPSSPSVWAHHHSLSPNSLSYAAVEQNLGFLNDPFSKNVEFFEQVPSSIDLAVSPGCRSDSMGAYPFWENSSSASSADNSAHFHRRSASFNDCYYGTDDSTSGFGFKPCLYYSRGFCKNGNACNKYDAFEQCQEEIFRSKLAQQQRLAAQLMSGGMNLPYNKLNFLQTEAQRSAAAALMMGEEFHKLHGRVRMSRNDFAGMYSNPGSRQIYLTFPADSTFKEEDVSSYFNLYGPVQDVRIPYQQKRMFGFVTFVYPETVKLILAKGNPHFVCDSRVLVKPYKEKSKLPDKKQHQQQMERGDFSSCSSPSGHDCRDPYEFQLGGRMLYSTQEMLLRKKLEEQADFQQALEFQERRLMNLQLLDLKNQQHQHNASVGSPMSSPHFAPAPSNQTVPPPSNGISHDGSEENNSPTGASDEQLAEGGGVNAALSDCNGNGQNKEDNRPKNEENELAESGLEHILPDNLFASPKKSVSEHRSSVFLPEFDNGGVTATAGSSTASCDTSMPASSPLGLAPHKSCYFEMPRLSPGQGALGM